MDDYTNLIKKYLSIVTIKLKSRELQELKKSNLEVQGLAINDT